MGTQRQRVVPAKHVAKAGDLIHRLLDSDTQRTRHSPAVEDLLAANRESDPVARVKKKVAALKKGAREAQAARDRLRSLQRQAAAATQGVSFSPEAEAELEELKKSIRQKIRKRAEEEIARQYPAQTTGRKTRPPKRNRISV